MSVVDKIALYGALAVFLLNVLAQVAKRAGWTRVQWFIEAITPLAIDAAGRAAGAPANAKQIQDNAKAIAIAQESPGISLHVSSPGPTVDVKTTVIATPAPELLRESEGS